MASLALIFDILAKDGASGPFRNVGNAAESAGKKTSTFGTAISGAMKLAAGAFLGAGLIEGFKALYEAADESRKIGALTSAVIKSTGGVANVTAKQVGDLAASIAKKTGVDDEAIQSGENLLLTFTNVKNGVGKGNDIFNQATVAITDMSVALGKDAPSSAVMLGKALNDPIKGITALSKAGVSFTEQQKEQIKTLVASGDTLGAQKIILGELTKEFGGAAEAAATPLGKLQQRVGDLAEKIGGYLIPIVDSAATFFSDKLLPAFSNVGSMVGATVVPAFSAIGAVVGAVADVFNALPGPLQTVAVALGAFSLLHGPVSSALETIGLKALYMKDSLTGAVTSVGGFKGAMSTLAGAFSPLTLGITAAVLALPSLIELVKKMTGNSDTAAASQRTLADALRATNGVIDDNARAAAKQSLISEDLVKVLDAAGVSSRDAIDGLLGNAAATDRVNKALQDMITSGLSSGDMFGKQVVGAGDARDKYMQLSEALGMSKEQAEFFADSATGAATATGTAATATDALTSAADENRSAMDEAKQAIDDYKLSLDILTGDNVSLIQVQAAFGDALREADGALKDLDGSVLNADGSLNAYSESGSKASDVLIDVRNTGNALISTMREQGATADQVSAQETTLRQSFINTANQMGITGQNAETLADKILGIPGSRTSTIQADTSQATAAIQNVKNFLAGFTDKTVTVTVRQVATQVGNFLAGFAPPRAEGGPVWPGQTFLVGERGPELVQFGAKGFVTPNAQTRQVLGSGGPAGPPGSSTPVLNVENYHAGGQSPMEVAESLAWMARTRG